MTRHRRVSRRQAEAERERAFLKKIEEMGADRLERRWEREAEAAERVRLGAATPSDLASIGAWPTGVGRVD